MPDGGLTLAGLTAYYGDVQALYGVDASVSSGEVVAIIGANGAGKTTLMHSIAGLMRNGCGQVHWRGRDISRLRADEIAHMGIALVPEGRRLFPSLSVEENLIIGGQVGRRGPWSLARVQALFPILKERARMPATALSGGQQQMVAIGRALMANPDLLLLDEISLGLAPVVIRDIYASLPAIIGEGMSALLVEQDISRALAASQRMICLKEGRISLTGASASVSREEISRAYFGM